MKIKFQLVIVVFFLIGCSGGSESNSLPVVSIFGPSEVLELSQVELTSVSEDSDGSISSYLWTQVSGPILTLTQDRGPSLSFVAPEVELDQVVTLQLTVKDNDGGVTSSEPISIIVKQSLADLNTINDFQVIEDDTEASVFISSLMLDIEPGLLDEISFKIEPMMNSVAEPIYAIFNVDMLAQGTQGIILPIFGLYSGYLNNIELTFLFIDGSSSSFFKEVQAEVYDNPLTLEVITPPDSLDKPSYSYFYLKSFYGIHILDIDGNFRWAANDPINSISSLYENGVFRVFVDDEMHELKLSGQAVISNISHDGLSNIKAHHDVEFGKSGYLVEIDADKVNRPARIIESILLEVDSTGNTIKEWDLGEIFREYIESQGYDSSNFVRDGADWFHMNSAIYDPSDDSIIASSRENFVVKIDYSSGKIAWLLGDETKHWYVNYPPLQELSLSTLDLKPIGQHSLSLVEGDLMLFNNGQYSFQNPEGVPRGEVLTSSPSSIYSINSNLKEAEVVWNYDPSIYSDVCSSIHRDTDSSSGDYLVNYSVVNRLDTSEPKKPVRTLIRGISQDMEMLFEFQLPTTFCRTSWHSRPISELSNLRLID